MVSDFIKLSPKQMETVQRLGFCDGTWDTCDCSDDGVVSMADQTDSFTSVNGYEQAFVNLAILGGEPNAIDSIDLSMLEDKQILAEVIAGDPSYRVIVSRGTALEYNEEEVPPGDLKPGIPPRNYRRLTYYSQMALAKIVDPKLVADGVFGDETKRVAEIFQKKLVIMEEDGTVGDGQLLGRRTIGALIMKCRYSRWKMVSILAGDADFLSTNGAFSLLHDGGIDESHNEAYAHLVMAMKWLGWIDESVKPEKAEKLVRDEIMKRFEGTTKIGPKAIGWIIDKVKAQDFKIDKT